MTTTTTTRTERTARERAVIAHLNDMFHVGFAEIGIDDVWASARRGRGRVLVVEENYRAERSRLVGNTVVATAEDGPDAVDDPVQEVIRLVNDSGGDVEFVAPDSLVDLGRIGLVVGSTEVAQ